MKFFKSFLKILLFLVFLNLFVSTYYLFSKNQFTLFSFIPINYNLNPQKEIIYYPNISNLDSSYKYIDKEIAKGTTYKEYVTCLQFIYLK